MDKKKKKYEPLKGGGGCTQTLVVDHLKHTYFCVWGFLYLIWSLKSANNFGK